MRAFKSKCQYHISFVCVICHELLAFASLLNTRAILCNAGEKLVVVLGSVKVFVRAGVAHCDGHVALTLEQWN